MNFDVPDSEKRVAEKASELFEEIIGHLKLASNHLNIIYEPFKKYNNIDTSKLLEYREVFRNYRDQIKKNYVGIMKIGFKAVVLMGEFSVDTKTVEMMDSFIANIKDLETQVNRLLTVFSDISGSNFQQSLIKGIDNVKKQSNQLKRLINDRVLDHIDTNILAKKWTSNITDNDHNKIYEKMPLIVELYKERQQALENMV